MRYIINDDDFEEWVKLLVKAEATKDYNCVEYIIEQMKIELTEHFTPTQIEKFFSYKGNE